MIYEQTRPVVFISAELPHLTTDQNFARSFKLGRTLTVDLGMPAKRVEGRYKGFNEHSYMVGVRKKDVKDLLELAKELGQEAILLRDVNKRCELLFTDGQRETLGHMVKVPAGEAKALDSYTYDPETDAFYIIK